jgi:hypothetical protein
MEIIYHCRCTLARQRLRVEQRTLFDTARNLSTASITFSGGMKAKTFSLLLVREQHSRSRFFQGTISRPEHDAHPK